MAGIQNTILFSQGEKLQVSTSEDITGMQTLSTDISRVNYTGNPEGNISANPSSLCHDPVSGNIYYKQTGTGNTGWIPIPSGMQSFTGLPVNLLATGLTNIFVPVFDFVVTQVTMVGTSIVGIPGTPIADFGFNNPSYNNITNGFQSFSGSTGSANGIVLGATFGDTAVITAASQVKINVTTADLTASTNTQTPILFGFYVF